MKSAFPDSRYEVHTVFRPEVFTFAFEPTLFNLPEYLALTDQEGKFSFYLVRKSSGQIVALFHGYKQENNAASPLRAPFGSFETSPELSLKLTEAFVSAVFAMLKTEGAEEISIKHYPFCYGNPQSALVVNSLLYFNLAVTLSQVNHHLPVTETPFEQLLHPSERRRLQKCRNQGFTFQPENPTVLPETYAFIKACREEKNKPLSLPETDLQKLFTTFPDRYFIFSVRREAEIAAVTVAVKVRSDVLLTFYPASPYAYNALSPAVMLNEGLYNFCRQQNIATLDYGISGVKEDPHYSLMQFKEHLGGVPSLKLTFSGKLK